MAEPQLFKTPPVAVNGQRFMQVTEREYALIVMSLILLRRKIRRDARQSKVKGFVPEPGRIDINAMRGKDLARLMERLGIDRKGDGS